MSISPPSDIVLEVARAADPEKLAAATGRLREIAATRGRDTGGFESLVAEAARPLVPLPPVEPDLPRIRMASLSQSTAPIGAGPDLPAPRVAAGSPAEQFEAQFLRQFVETMLPETPALYGEGTAGSIWRGFLAEEVGAELARAGGVGIAAAVAQAHPELAQVRAAASTLWPEHAAGNGPPDAATASGGTYFTGFYRT